MVEIDLDDKVLHYLLVGAGVVAASFIHTAIDFFTKVLWKKTVKVSAAEYHEFQKWKKSIL